LIFSVIKSSQIWLYDNLSKNYRDVQDKQDPVMSLAQLFDNIGDEYFHSQIIDTLRLCVKYNS